MTDTTVIQAGDASSAHTTARQPGFDEKSPNKNDVLPAAEVIAGDVFKDDQLEVTGGLAGAAIVADDHFDFNKVVIEDERQYTQQHFQKIHDAWKDFKTGALKKYRPVLEKRVRAISQLWQARAKGDGVEKYQAEVAQYEKAKQEYEASLVLYNKNKQEQLEQSRQRLEEKNLSTVVNIQLKNRAAEKNKKRQDILSVLSNPQLLISKLDNLFVIIRDKPLILDKAGALKLAVENLQCSLKELIELKTKIATHCANSPLSPTLQDELAKDYLKYQSKRTEFLNQFDSFKQTISNFTTGQQTELARAANELAPFLNATVNSLTSSVFEAIAQVYPDRAAVQAGFTELFDRYEKACQPWHDLIYAADSEYKKLEMIRDGLIASYKEQGASPEFIQSRINDFKKDFKKGFERCNQNKQQAQEKIAEFIKQHKERLAVLDTQLDKTCGAIQNEVQLKESLIEFQSLLKIVTDKTQKNDRLLKRMKARLHILTKQILTVYQHSNQEIPKNREEAMLFADCLEVLNGNHNPADPLWSEFHKTGSLTTIRLNIRRTLSAVTDALNKTVNPFLGAALTLGSVLIYAVEIAIHGGFGSSKFDSSRTNNLGNAVVWTGLNSEGLDAAASPLADCATTTGGLAGFDFPLELKQNRIDLKAGRERLNKMKDELADINVRLQNLRNSKNLTKEELKEVASLTARQSDLLAEIPVTDETISDVRSKRYKVTTIAGTYAATGAVATTGSIFIAAGITTGLGPVGGAVSAVGSAIGLKFVVGFGAFIAGSVLSGGALIAAAAAVTAIVSLSWLAYKIYKWATSETDAQSLAKHNCAKPVKNLSMAEAESRAKLSIQPAAEPALSISTPTVSDTSCSIGVTPVPLTPAAGIVAIDAKAFAENYLSIAPAVRPLTATPARQSTFKHHYETYQNETYQTVPAVRPSQLPSLLQTKQNETKHGGKKAEMEAANIRRPTTPPPPITGRDSVTFEAGVADAVTQESSTTSRPVTPPSATTSPYNTDFSSGSDSDGSTQSSRNSTYFIPQGGTPAESADGRRPPTSTVAGFTLAQLLASTTTTQDSKEPQPDDTLAKINKTTTLLLNVEPKNKGMMTEPSADTLGKMGSDIVVSYSAPVPLNDTVDVPRCGRRG